MHLLKIFGWSLVLLCFFGCDGPKEPEFLKLHNIKFSDLKLPPNFGMGVTADAMFHNPNAIGMTINGMDLEVFVDGKKATDLEQKLSTKISGSSDFTLPVKFRIPLSEKSLIKNLSHMLTGAWKKQSVKIKVTGTITIDAAGVDISVPVAHEDDYKFKDYLLK